jgi:two-component system, cell cycle response regulator DivK
MAPSPQVRAEPLVLVVDDDERNRKLARDVLRADGLETVEAGTGGDALAAASEHLPDLVLLDMQLPDIDGMEVARRLRADARTAAIPLVAFTASRRMGTAGDLKEAGLDGYVEKPFDVRSFPAQVRGFCTPSGG